MLDLRRLLGGLSCTALAVLAGCGSHAATDSKKGPSANPADLPVIKAAVLTVESSPWPAIVKTQGSLIADEVTVIGSKVAGRVAEVRVDLGDVVSADAPLATLDQEEFKLQIALVEAQLGQARAALGLKEEDPVASLKPENAPPVREARAVWDEVVARIERMKPSLARGAVTKEVYELALADEGVAAARFSAAINAVREKIAIIGVRAAELSLAQQKLADTTIKAPFEGLVKQRHVGPGSYVQVGDPVVTLVRTSTLRFRGTMPERHSHRLALGQQIKLRIESLGEPQNEEVTRISPGVDEMNRSLVFEAAISNTAGNLRAGLFAEAEVIVDPDARAIVVPQSAIVEFAGVEKVWKVVDGVAQEHPVKTSRRGHQSIEVTGGLAEGDVILADASQGRAARVEAVPGGASGRLNVSARSSDVAE